MGEGTKEGKKGRGGGKRGKIMRGNSRQFTSPFIHIHIYFYLYYYFFNSDFYCSLFIIFNLYFLLYLFIIYYYLINLFLHILL